MKRVEYVVGHRFSGTRLAYIQEVPRVTKTKRRALFQCDCGKRVEADIGHVIGKRTMSCGCLFSEHVLEVNKIHGQCLRTHRSGAYRSWQAMHQRCKVDPLYQKVNICSEWEEFEKFYADMGDRPQGFTIERKNGLDGYNANNCIWASVQTQAANRRTNVYVTINDRTETVSEWCRHYGISRFTVNTRVRSGMPVVEAIIKPLERKKRAKEES